MSRQATSSASWRRTPTQAINAEISRRLVCVPLICRAHPARGAVSISAAAMESQVVHGRRLREMCEGYVLLSLGLNVKTWSAGEERTFAFRSSYVPLCLINSLLPSLTTKPTCARQMPCFTWRGGAACHLSPAISCNGAGICTAASKRPHAARLAGRNQPGPSGAAGLLQERLTPDKAKDLLPWLLCWCRISKPFPAMLFQPGSRGSNLCRSFFAEAIPHTRASLNGRPVGCTLEVRPG